MLIAARFLFVPVPSVSGLHATVALASYASYTDELDTARRVLYQQGWEAGVAYVKNVSRRGALRADFCRLRINEGRSFERVAPPVHGWVGSISMQYHFGSGARP